MKRTTAIAGLIMIIVFTLGAAAYGAGKAECGTEASGQGVSTQGTGGQTTGAEQAGSTATQGLTGIGAAAGGRQGGLGTAGQNVSPESAAGQGVAPARINGGFESGVSQKQTPIQGSVEREQGQGKVNINTASADVLRTVPGIDTTLADNIVAYRQSNGPFESVDDLIRVQGVDKDKLNSIRTYLKVSGLSNFEPGLAVPQQRGPFPTYTNPPE